MDSLFTEGVGYDDRMQRDEWFSCLVGEVLALLAYFDYHDIVSKQGWKKVPYSYDFLGGSHSGKVAAACACVAIVQGFLRLIVSEALPQDYIDASPV